MSLYYCCQAPHTPFLIALAQLLCHFGSYDWGQPACKRLCQYVLVHKMLYMAVQAEQLMCHSTVEHISLTLQPKGTPGIQSKLFTAQSARRSRIEA